MEREHTHLPFFADLLDAILLETNDSGLIITASGSASVFQCNPSAWEGMPLSNLLDDEALEEVSEKLAAHPDQKVVIPKAAVYWQGHARWMQCTAKRIPHGMALVFIPADINVEEEEEALQEADMFRLAVQDAYDAICITNGNPYNPEIMYVNASFCKMTGYSQEELLGQNPKMLQGPQTDREVIEGLKVALAEGKPYRSHTVNYRKDGTPYDVEWHISPLRNPQGEIVRYVSIQHDITDTTLTMKRLVKEGQRLEMAQRIAKIGGWTVDLESGKIYWSTQVKRLHEVPMDYEPELESAINFYHPDYRDIIREAVDRGVNNQEPWDLECKFVTAKGKLIWVRAMGIPVIERGKVVQLTGIFQDIDEHKKAQEAVEEFYHFYKLSNDLLSITSFEGHFTKVNPHFERVLGYTAEELTSQPFINFVHPADREATMEEAKALVTEKPEVIQFRNRYHTKQGEVIWLEWNAISDFESQKLYAVARNVTVDISQKKQLEEYQKLFNLTPDILSIIEPSGNFIEVNQGWVLTLGVNLQQTNEIGWLNLVVEEDREILKEALRRLREGEEEIIWQLNVRVIGVSGALITIQWSSAIDRETMRIYNVGRDISQMLMQEEELKKKREMERALLAAPGAMVCLIAANGTILSVNSAWDEFSTKNNGDPATTGVGVNYFKVLENAILKGHTRYQVTLDGMKRVVQERVVYEEEYPCHGPHEERWFKMRAEPLIIEEGGAIVSHVNITEKHKALEVLKGQKYQFEILARNLREVFWIRQLGGFVFLSDSVESLWELPMDEVLANPNLLFEAVVKEDQPRVWTALEEHYRGAPFNEEYRIRTQTGGVRWILHRADAIRDYEDNLLFVGTASDVSHIKSTEESLKRALEDKNMLIRELHHRVKNNLQLISSILYMKQHSAREDERLMAFIQDTDTRIKALSKIHERLLQVSGIDSLSIKEYLEGLAADISSSYIRDSNKVRIDLAVQDVALDVDVVSTLGLLVNELVSNALKHAFVGLDKGQVWVSFKHKVDHYLLVVKDNGIGMDSTKKKSEETLGMLFVEVFTQQLGADLSLIANEGTEVRVKIPL